jgi:hypothetical protein
MLNKKCCKVTVSKARRGLFVVLIWPAVLKNRERGKRKMGERANDLKVHRRMGNRRGAVPPHTHRTPITSGAPKLLIAKQGIQ